VFIADFNTLSSYHLTIASIGLARLPAKGRYVIELHAKNMGRINMPDQKQFLDELKLDSRLTDLSRAANRNDRRDAGI